MNRLIAFILGVCASVGVCTGETLSEKPDSVASAPSLFDTSQIGARVFRLGVSAAMNYGLTELFKHSIHEIRPNRSGNDSWPSRHTSMAFSVALKLSHELYGVSPWIVVGSHVAADAVGLQRLFSGKHYPKDVLGGAMIGLGSSEFSYWLTGLIFPESVRRLPYCEAEWGASLDVTTEAVFPLCGGDDDISVRTGFNSAVRLTMPFAENVGAVGAINVGSLPIYKSGRYMSMLNSVGVSAGVAGMFPSTYDRIGMNWRVLAGVLRHFDGQGFDHPGYSFTADAQVSGAYQLTPDLALGVDAGYRYIAMPHSLHAITLSIFSRIQF